MTTNKNGIPVCTGKPMNKRMKRQQEVQKLNYKKFAEFMGFVDGIEVRVLVLNMKSLINAMKSDGWIYVGLTDGEL